MTTSTSGVVRSRTPSSGRRVIRFRRALDGDEWDGLLAREVGATAFHSWRWLSAVSGAFGWYFLPLVVVESGEAVGVFPVLLRSRLLRISPVIPFPYVGPVVAEHLLTDVLTAFRREQLRRILPRVLVSFSPRWTESSRQAMRQARYLYRTDLTYVVDLRGRSTDAIEARLRADRRKALRKARRNEVLVRPAQHGELTELLPLLQTEAFARRGLPSPYPGTIGTVVQDLVDDGAAIAATALVRGEVAGGMVALLDGASLLNWTAGCLRAHRDSDANTLLHVQMLQEAAADGYDEFDMVGHVDAGVASFKSSIGAQPREFVSGSTTLLPGPVVRGLSAWRERTRRRARGGTAG